MTKEEMKERFKMFAIATAKLIMKLPVNTVNKAYSGQLVRSSSSTVANYRAALRGKSTADFINKLKIVEEEMDESILFFELIEAINPTFKNDIEPLHKEANELLSIVVASLITLRKNNIKSN